MQKRTAAPLRIATTTVDASAEESKQEAGKIAP